VILSRPSRSWPFVGALMLIAGIAGGGLVRAQLAPGDRGIAPVDSSSNLEVTNVTVDVSARTAETARMAGWREAQRKAWKVLYARLHGVPLAEAQGLPDSTLDSIVAGIEVENEQIGPTRYIGRLGVLFDRARAAAYLGDAGGVIVRSQPVLVIPVEYSGGATQVFERRTEWQRAWARFRTASSAIDYVRPVGSGSDPIMLDAGQTGRRGRGWWRMLLDQYGASDVVMPEVRLRRAWPGGPVRADFIARHGPDGVVLDAFTLVAADDTALDSTLDEGIRRIDAAYTAALRQGRFTADPTLVAPEPVAPPPTLEEGIEDDPLAEVIAGIDTNSFTLQVDTADAAALDSAQASLRALPGVRSVGVSSLALGGISLLRIGFEGERGALRLALQSHGWRVDDAGDGFHIRRGGGPAAAPPAP
jgi:hypothetical protein